MEDNFIMKNGYIGRLNGWRIRGKSFDSQGNEIDEIHEKYCVCCRDNLLSKPPLKDTTEGV